MTTTKKAISRIESEMELLRQDIQNVFDENLNDLLGNLRARLSGLQTALDICIEVDSYVEPTRLQKSWIKKAGRLLSADGGDDEILSMIGKIKDEPNQTMLIDYVDGVTVWQKVELEFTCDEFLKEIGFLK